MPKVTTKEIRGVKRDIHVDERGMFYHTLNGGDKVTAPTLEILEKKLITATAPERQNLNIKFVRIYNRNGSEDSAAYPSLLHGTVTGKHATNNNMLVRFEGEKGTLQESMYMFGRLDDQKYLRMTESQEKFLLTALEEEAVAYNRVEEMIKRYSFDIRTEVESALKKLGVQDGD